MSFSCPHRGTRWITDYDVQHVTSHGGATRQYYCLNAIPVPAPAGEGCVTCRACGATHLYPPLITRRDIPPPGPGPDQHRRRLTGVDEMVILLSQKGGPWGDRRAASRGQRCRVSNPPRATCGI